MRHSLRVDGFAFALRPIELKDAEFVVATRTSDPNRTRFLNAIPPDVDAQRRWLESYFERSGDYYWVVERIQPGSPEGLVGIYNIDEAASSGEWGRWVLKPSSLAAIESALLVYRAAFQVLQLQTLYCLTIADNLPVLAFHDACGLQRTELLPQHFDTGSKKLDAVRHVCSIDQWSQIQAKLEPQAQALARRLR